MRHPLLKQAMEWHYKAPIRMKDGVVVDGPFRQVPSDEEQARVLEAFEMALYQHSPMLSRFIQFCVKKGLFTDAELKTEMRV